MLEASSNRSLSVNILPYGSLPHECIYCTYQPSAAIHQSYIMIDSTYQASWRESVQDTTNNSYFSTLQSEVAVEDC